MVIKMPAQVNPSEKRELGSPVPPAVVFTPIQRFVTNHSYSPNCSPKPL
jgi:hypothetical protein